VTASESIRVEQAADCLFCKVKGTQLYAGLRDRLFAAPGVWSFLRCPQCGLVWLNPRPVAADLPKVYANYFTHQEPVVRSTLPWLREKVKLGVYAAVPGYRSLADGWPWRWLGRLLIHVPTFRERCELGVMCLTGEKRGRLLDVGCGSGSFLAFMRRAAWEVHGVEPDPAAAKVAQERFGIPVILGTLPAARLPDASFDAITLNHVIEHVEDPIGLLAECRRILKPDGTLVIVTPNIESLGHQHFRDSWRGLEPPRHLYLFSIDTLRTSAGGAGFRNMHLGTSSRSARYMWMASHVMKKQGMFSDSDMTWRLRFGGLAFRIREEITRLVREPKGEELLLIASPKT